MPKAGLFAGEVTTAAPADGAITTKNKGYQWMEYGNVIPPFVSFCNEIFGITATVPDLHVAGLVNGVWNKGVIIGTGTIVDDRVDVVLSPNIDGYYHQIASSTLIDAYYANCQWYAYSGRMLQNRFADNTFDYGNTEWNKQDGATTLTDGLGLDPSQLNWSSKIIDGQAGQTSNTWKRSTLASVIGTDLITAVGVFKKDLTANYYSLLSIRQLTSGAEITHALFNQADGSIEVLDTSTGSDAAAEVRDAGEWWEVYIQTRSNGSTGNNLENTGQFAHAPAFNTDGTSTPDVTVQGQLQMGESKIYYPASIGQVRGGAVDPRPDGSASSVIDQSEVYIDIANHSGIQGGYYIEWRPMYSHDEITDDVEILSLNGGNGLLYYDHSTKELKSTDGTNTASVGIDVIAENKYRCGVIFGSNLRVGVNSVWGNEVAYDGAFPVGTDFHICRNPEAINYWRELRGYQISYADAFTEISLLMGGLRPPVFTGAVVDQEWLTTESNSLDLLPYFNNPADTYTFTIESGALPTGMSLNASSGLISGQPTIETTGTLVVRCTNSLGTDVTNSFDWESASSFTPVGIVAYAMSSESSASSFTVSLPTVESGQTLVVSVYHDSGSNTDPFFTTWDSGWTKLYDYGNATAKRTAIFTKVSDGTETTFSCTTVLSDRASFISYAIKGTLDFHNAVEISSTSPTVIVPQTNVNADSFALALFGSDNSGATSTINNGFTKVDEIASDVVLAFATQSYESSGNTGTTTATFSASDGVMSAMMTFS